MTEADARHGDSPDVEAHAYLAVLPRGDCIREPLVAVGCRVTLFSIRYKVCRI